MQYADFDCAFTAGCTYTSPSAVSAGHRVVIQHVTGNLEFQTAPSWVLVRMVLSPGTSISGPAFFNVPPGPAGTFLYFDQPTLYYFDAGQFLQVSIFSNVSYSGINQQLTLIGYELDCTAAPCAAIANQ
jgi:hypothetical protein